MAHVLAFAVVSCPLLASGALKASLTGEATRRLGARRQQVLSSKGMVLCEDCFKMFGGDFEGEEVSIVDVSANCYVHYLGSGTDCVPPTPPSGCHEYVKVHYDDCKGLGNHKDATRKPRPDLFDSETGIFEDCKDKVKKKEVHKYEKAPSGGGVVKC